MHCHVSVIHATRSDGEGGNLAAPNHSATGRLRTQHYRLRSPCLQAKHLPLEGVHPHVVRVVRVEAYVQRGVAQIVYGDLELADGFPVGAHATTWIQLYRQRGERFYQQRHRSNSSGARLQRTRSYHEGICPRRALTASGYFEQDFLRATRMGVQRNGGNRYRYPFVIQPLYLQPDGIRLVRGVRNLHLQLRGAARLYFYLVVRELNFYGSTGRHKGYSSSFEMSKRQENNSRTCYQVPPSIAIIRDCKPKIKELSTPQATRTLPPHPSGITPVPRRAELPCL
ncbi:hypothetical protein HRbin16_03042 [bacterium HR16]|nr:hypothetical protein HRbin16_03042 [bacterium HR16]